MRSDGGRLSWKLRCVAIAMPLLITLMLAATTNVRAQSTELPAGIKLTAEQRNMLEQLPASQREALMRAIQNATAEKDEAEEPEFPDLLEYPDREEDQFGLGNTMPLEQVIEGGETLVVELIFKLELKQEEVEAALEDPDLRAVIGSQYYQLDDDGVLELPGLARVPLAGLSEEDIATRLGAEPDLELFEVTATILAVEPSGKDALARFGYDLFEGVPTTFAPATDVPVPTDYVLGPGDSIELQFYGAQNESHSLTVGRDGKLHVPNLGPVNAAGLDFGEFREELRGRVSAQMIGTQVSITMGELRSIRVFVVGDVRYPGSYTLSSLSSMTHALFLSGGVSEVGSLRKIQLKRNGKVVSTLDLYHLLLRGDTSGDRQLLPGDVVFVPPMGATAGAVGSVKRPAIYELAGEKTVAQLVALAGGLTPQATANRARLERIGEDSVRTIVDVNLSRESGRNLLLKDGDLLDVPSVVPDFLDAVTLTGHVHRSGGFQWRQGMRLTDLIDSVSLLRENSDLGYIMVRREVPPDRRIEILSANLLEAWANPAGPENIRLEPRDTVYVFDLETGRRRIIEPLLEELRLQTKRGYTQREVTVEGSVRAPGRYPLEPGMRVSDLLRAGGSLSEDAYPLSAELSRYRIVNDSFRETELVRVDLSRVLAGDEAADLLLGPYDYLNIKELPLWGEQYEVEILGEVKFPGKYPIRRGESLGSVLDRAGGLTEFAFPEGAIFLREELREREKEQFEMLSRRLESDLISLSLQTTMDSSGAETLQIGQSLLAQMRSIEPVGRLVIDLESFSAAERAAVGDSLILKDGDQLLVPRRPQEVTVIGEVQYATSHIYREDLSRSDFIAQSGGLTNKADKKRIYVVRASGAVSVESGSLWFGRRGSDDIRPGDTIVVPLDTDRVRPLTLWTSVTQILYNVAISVAAVNSF